MSPLIMDIKKLKQLRDYAEGHRIGIAEVREMVDNKVTQVGDRPEHVCYLYLGFKIVYSIEEHPLKDGSGTVWRRHLSMSVNRPGKVPSPQAVSLVAKELGFPDLAYCYLNLQTAYHPNYVEVMAKLD